MSPNSKAKSKLGASAGHSWCRKRGSRRRSDSIMRISCTVFHWQGQGRGPATDPDQAGLLMCIGRPARPRRLVPLERGRTLIHD